MRIYTKSIFCMTLFCVFFGQYSYSSFQGVPKEVKEESFFREADGMKFKELRDYSLVDKEHYARVVAYFKQRMEKLKKTPCPVLTQDWIKENEGKKFLQELPSYHEPGRSLQEQKKDIVSIDGIKWAIDQATTNPQGLQHAYSDRITTREFRSEDLTPLKEGIFTRRFPKKGPLVSKVCQYYRDNKEAQFNTTQIYLIIADEFLDLPDLEFRFVLRHGDHRSSRQGLSDGGA